MNQPTTFAILLCLGLSLVTVPLRAENEVGFIERFALAPDREAVLGQLVPGTEDYYYFHALHYQNTAQKPKLAAILDQWSKRFPDSAQRRVMENREALIGYDTDPQRTLQYLRDHLNPQFNHVQEVPDRKPDLPTALDPALVTRDVFLKAALQHDGLTEVTDEELERLVRDQVPLRPPQIRSLLARLRRPDVPGLVEMIAGNLKTKESRGFGEFPIHRALLPTQLDALQKLVPTVAEQMPFVGARLRKLAPGADADTEFDPAEREAWLDRSWDYVRTLSSTFNSLKAHILYTRLQHDRSKGVHDRARFLEYLKLPRPVGYMNPKYLEQADVARHPVDLNATFKNLDLQLAPIGSDEALVREFVLYFSIEDAAWEPWTEWLRDTWVKPVFAEAKITAGVGDPEQWASLLSPSAYQALKERVDIEFPPTNAPFIPVDGDVGVDVIFKHAPKIIVRIHELNTLGFFLSQKRPLNTDLNLDGLVANIEQTHDGDASPFKRVTRTFQFPELKGKRGAWVIEFIGGGKSSRALIRKGQYSLVQQAGPAGDLLTILDENHRPAPGAVAWLDGRKLAPDPKDGRILVPFTTQPGRRPIVLADAPGGFASLATFDHHAEAYRLDAQFHVEREQLLARREATLAVRTALLVGDARVAPELLQDGRLTIVSTTLDGISTTSEVKAPALEANKVFTHKFSVPDRLAQLTVTLSGRVDLLGQAGEKRQLSATRTWNLNGIDRTEATSDGHLSKLGENHVFELLGKNAEPVPDQQVLFHFRHDGFSRIETAALRTDDRGRVMLGKLDGIVSVNADLPNGRKKGWSLDDLARTWPQTLHAKSGEVIRVPWNGEVRPGSVSLLETRNGDYVADLTASVKPVGAFLEITGLKPGDYSLRLHDDGTHTLDLRVTEGVLFANWLLSTNRLLEVRDATALQIESASVTTNGVSVQLRNWNPFTRVHVGATRFLPGQGLFGGLAGFTRFGPSWGSPDKLPNLYATGRAIGDEYRYILERRYAPKFPGNMLARPGLLLNPWEKRSTDAQALSLERMQEPMAMGGARAGALMDSASMAAIPTGGGLNTDDENLDFLADAAPVLYNLVPDAQGVVRVPPAALGDRQHVQIYAEDLANAVWGTFTLGEQATRFRDLRLARNLDPAKPSTERKEITVLAPGGILTIADILTGDLETYDTLASVHALFTSLNGDANFARFAWILQWPTLKDAEKQARYSEFACHELNFFLSRKDPQFFARVIQPYLKNKKDKTFLDDYLLESDLKRFLEPWAYARLNVVERALLARRLPGETANTARHLMELWELLPPNPEEDDRLFETGLRGRALEQMPTGGAGGGGGFGGGFREAKGKIEQTEAERATFTPLTAAAPRSASVLTRDGRPLVESAAAGRFRRLASDKDMAKNAVRLSVQAEGLNQDRANAPVLADLPGFTQSTNSFGESALYFAQADVNRLRGLGLERAYYRALGPTKEWAENNYYQLPIDQQNADLVTINAFWRDFAAWDGRAPFLSSHLAEAHRNFTEMMLALAVLDLPFEAPKHVGKTENNSFTFTAGGAAIVFHRQFQPAEAQPAGAGPALLISESFYRHGDRYRQEGNEKFDKFVTGEFLASVVYGAQLVVSNPGSAPLKLDLLTQVPRGALPVLGSKATDSHYIRLEPYTTRQSEYYFYFPSPGTNGTAFPHFPANLTLAGKSVGAAQTLAFQVVRKLSQIDRASWEYVSQLGTDAEVFDFLGQNNVARLNLERVAWRARARVDFFRQLVVFLQSHHVWSEPIYRYAILHNDAVPLGEWLRHRDDFLGQCGPWLTTRLVSIDPVERRTHEHLEYSPLVNQRAHQVGSEHRIANPVFREQYQRLLGILAHKPAPAPAENLAVVYYLFLQDRVGEALERLRGVQPDSIPTRLQFDYLRCHAAFYEERLADARGIAAQYSGYPVDRWRGLFTEVTAQLDEIEGKTVVRPGDAPDREKRQGELAATEPAFEFKVEKRAVALTWKNLGEVTINYYLMDPEFLFSSSPFVTRDAGRFSIINPTLTAVQSLPAGRDNLEIPLPARFAQANVLVEVLGAGLRKAEAYHANSFKLAVTENYGRLELRDQAGDRPVGKAYIKVYARLRNGTVRFYKDGYTDLRGKFDYASLNSGSPPQPVAGEPGEAGGANGLDYQMLRPGELDSVDRLSILVLSDTHGAAVREVAPPRG